MRVLSAKHNETSAEQGDCSRDPRREVLFNTGMANIGLFIKMVLLTLSMLLGRQESSWSSFSNESSFAGELPRGW